MISLIGLSKRFSVGSGTKVIFDEVDLELPTDRKLALLGPRGSGKSTFLRLLAGLERPSSGKIERRTSVSLPVGYGRAFIRLLSPRQNAVFFADCYGADSKEVVVFVESVAEMGRFFDVPMRDIPAEMRTRFAFALSYAIPLGLYLVDGMPATGSEAFQRRCFAMFEERAKTSGILFATSNPKFARDYCDQALVIVDGKIVLYADLEEAIRTASRRERAKA